VVSRLADETFDVAQRGVRQSGRARGVEVDSNFLTLLANSRPMRAALRRDPAQFLRVATRPGPVKRALTTLMEELLRGEVERRTLHLSTDLGALAAAMVRIAEATLHADILAGRGARRALVGRHRRPAAGAVRLSEEAGMSRSDPEVVAS
jgi:hypothetical protein